MLHGGDAKHVPFDRNALAASPFSYIALGHIHKPEVLLENRMAYAGSPEPLDMTETLSLIHIYNFLEKTAQIDGSFVVLKMKQTILFLS